MKAIVFTTYGSPDVLRYTDVEKPTPKANEVLVKIHAASVNAAECHIVRGDPFVVRLAYGLRAPKFNTPGADIAGVVEAVGAGVTQFQPGDAVYGDTSSCGFGAFAEYTCIPEQMLALKPERLTYEEAAAVPMAAVTALQGLRDMGKIRAGQKVLIHGASGGVGTFAVQIAKAFGAEVTAVCSTRKIEMVRSIGADHVIDYTREDFVTGGQRYDLILAANGSRSPGAFKRALKPNGICVVSGGSMSQIFQAMLLSPFVTLGDSRKVVNLLAKPNQADLRAIAKMIDEGKIRPVIDRCYPLSEAAEALRYVDEGHAVGKVVISAA